ncbi:MarR family transcriptional regulator [Streptomyces sp. C3-3]|uniref:MarR family transcriptional regulator n=1 Tax=Streptomyces sp. C3-3 TaxID=2824901 RepID=UPI001B389416|nr:MarR family transcriptional regulator [Streptomyces sp. C3-3]MBQ1115463.1 MarR family transcriptional regulator [Streptomyces sp. C3-3]
MATQHHSSAPHAPALSAAYPMAKPGYGKRSAPDQRPHTPLDFALLPTRERYVAGFVDHLPEGAAMSVKTLAKQLPLYGQQAISTALTTLSVAGHLRRVRCAVGQGETTRWAFRTFWSRTARDNEWWNTYLATENARDVAPAPGVSATASPPPPWVPAEGPPPPALPEGSRGEAAPESPEPSRADTAPGAVAPAEAPAPISVPHQRTPADPPDTAPGPGPARGTAAAASPTDLAVPAGPLDLKAPHSPAYLALARLGRTDQRLGLSADDCAALEAQAAEWFARGVDADYLTATLTAGLPAKVDSPLGFVRRRLADKIPPRLPAEQAPPGAPVHRVLMECTDCGTPGRPEALPDGLCRPCRTAHHPGAADLPAGTAEVPADARDIGAYIANLRDLLKAP